MAILNSSWPTGLGFLLRGARKILLWEPALLPKVGFFLLSSALGSAPGLHLYPLRHPWFAITKATLSSILLPLEAWEPTGLLNFRLSACLSVQVNSALINAVLPGNSKLPVDFMRSAPCPPGTSVHALSYMPPPWTCLLPNSGLKILTHNSDVCL